MTAWGNGRRAFFGVCAATLLATLAGCGGGGGGGGGGGSTPSTVVTGFVFNSANNDEVVEGATVTMGAVSGTTITRDNVTAENLVGSFRLENVPEGTVTATVTFLNSRQIGDTDQRETFTDTQTFTLFPPISRGSNTGIELFVNIGQINGRVLLPNGTAAAGANVFVSPSGLGAVADADGRFFIPNVPVEPIEVTGVVGTSSGTARVTIGNGTNNLGDLRLVEDPNPNPPGLPPTISGTVLLAGENGATATRGGGATVILLRDGSQLEQSFANTEGKFSFFVPVGNYTVRVFFDGYVDTSQDTIVNTPNQPRDLSVTLQRRL